MYFTLIGNEEREDKLPTAEVEVLWATVKIRLSSVAVETAVTSKPVRQAKYLTVPVILNGSSPV